MNKLNALLTKSCSVKMAGYWPISFSPIYSHLHQTSLLHKGFIIRLACSKLRDSGEKSFRKKKCEKIEGDGERSFPSWACLIFALLVLIRPAILSESLAQASCKRTGWFKLQRKEKHRIFQD